MPPVPSMCAYGSYRSIRLRKNAANGTAFEELLLLTITPDGSIYVQAADTTRPSTPLRVHVDGSGVMYDAATSMSLGQVSSWGICVPIGARENNPPCSAGFSIRPDGSCWPSKNAPVCPPGYAMGPKGCQLKPGTVKSFSLEGHAPRGDVGLGLASPAYAWWNARLPLWSALPLWQDSYAWSGQPVVCYDVWNALTNTWDRHCYVAGQNLEPAYRIPISIIPHGVPVFPFRIDGSGLVPGIRTSGIAFRGGRR